MSIAPLMPVYPRCGVRPVRGDHCHLIDEDGTRYLDFASGIAVNLLGHSHEGLIGAIQRQAATLMHVSNLYGSPQGEALAQKLVDHTFADTAFFTNSGAEAVETAIKTARAYYQHAGNEERYELITFKNAFHGRTMATISASNQEKMHKGFMPLLPGFQYAEFDNLDHAKSLMSDKTAGFLVEPIQGEGGLNAASDAWMQGVAKLAKKLGALLIVDDIQSGCGRTGTYFAFEKAGIEPDMITQAKSLSGFGLPFAALLIKPEHDIWKPAEHNGTFRGNTHAFVTARVAIEKFWKDKTFETELQAKTTLLTTGLQDLAALIPGATLKGRGLMQGVDTGSGDLAGAICARAFEKGLVIETSGADDEVVKVLAPLTTPDDTFRKGFAILLDAAREVTETNKIAAE